MISKLFLIWFGGFLVHSYISLCLLPWEGQSKLTTVARKMGISLIWPIWVIMGLYNNRRG